MFLPSFITFLLCPCLSRWQRPYSPGRIYCQWKSWNCKENSEFTRDESSSSTLETSQPNRYIDYLALCAKCSWKVVYKINICIWKSYIHSAFLCDFRNVFPHAQKKNVCPDILQNDAEAKHALGRTVWLSTPFMQEVHQTDNQSIWSLILLQKHNYVKIHNQFPLKYLNSLPKLWCSMFNKTQWK